MDVLTTQKERVESYEVRSSDIFQATKFVAETGNSPTVNRPQYLTHRTPPGDWVVSSNKWNKSHTI